MAGDSADSTTNAGAGVTSEAPIQTPFLEFREILAEHIKALETTYPERHSTTWYFLVYLRRVSRRAMATSTPRDVSGPVRGLTRFYVDSLDAGSELAERYAAILEAYRLALRLERRD